MTTCWHFKHPSAQNNLRPNGQCCAGRRPYRFGRRSHSAQTSASYAFMPTIAVCGNGLGTAAGAVTGVRPFESP
jgi:hypothetical protein